MPQTAPPKRVNPMADFMKETTQHWPIISAWLRARNYNPVAALEAEKSRRLGMHHEKHLANAFQQAKQQAELDRAKTKRTRKQRRREGSLL